MLLRGRISRAGRESCSDCLAPADALNASSRTGGRSLFALLMSAAEYGRLPDRVIRYGIRRLLKARLDSMDSDAERTLRFLQEAADQPIANMPD